MEVQENLDRTHFAKGIVELTEPQPLASGSERIGMRVDLAFRTKLELVRHRLTIMNPKHGPVNQSDVLRYALDVLYYDLFNSKIA